MQKKLLALALASAFAAPAFAATSNVDVGGYINMSVDYLDPDMADEDGNMNISSNSSNIYFKGTEDLGGGLKAIWQIQTYFSVGGTGKSDHTFGTADGVSSGNTYLGLQGGWGMVLAGKHDSPYKLVGRKYDFFNNQIGDSRNVINAASTDVRPNNVIAYGTPNINGFSALVAYVTNYSSGAATDDCTSGNLNCVDAWSVNGAYDNGPLSISVAYQQLNLSEANVVLVPEDLSSWRVGASYKFGDFKVAGLYQQDQGVAGISDLDYDAWGLGAAYKMGAFTIKGQYYNGEFDFTGNDGEVDLWAIGVDYSLSKRTTLYAAYAGMGNDDDTAFTPFGGGHGDNPGTDSGGDPSGFSLGMIHTF